MSFMSSKKSWLVSAGLCLFVGLAAFAVGKTVGEEKKVSRVYELRTYTTLEGRLPALHARFRDHTLKLFEKHGMKNEMYWVPTDEKLSQNTLIYVVSHASHAAAVKSWDAFRNDPEWHKARDASEKDGKIVAKVESVFMTPTEYSPPPK